MGIKKSAPDPAETDDYRRTHRSIQTDHCSREREVNTMAASIPVEQESGMSSGRVHSHNGYYAGEFTTPRHVASAAWHSPLPAAFDPRSS